MKFSQYEVFARMIPAVLTGIPFFVLYYFLVGPQLGIFFQSLFSLKIASDVTVAIAILYFAMQLNRHLSKELYERRLFKKGLHLPTTSYLLHSDHNLPVEVKSKLHEKIMNDFGILIPNVYEEGENEYRSRQIILECVSQIRLKVDKGTLTHQHNIEYGFVRNLVGGSALSLIVSAIATGIFLWIFQNQTALGISEVLALFYILVLIFSDHLVRAYGENYCQVLLREYLAQ